MLKMKTTAPIPTHIRAPGVSIQLVSHANVSQTPVRIKSQPSTPVSSATHVPAPSAEDLITFPEPTGVNPTPTPPEVEVSGALVADFGVIVESVSDTVIPSSQIADIKVNPSEGSARSEPSTGFSTPQIPGFLTSADVSFGTQTSSRQNWQLWPDMKDAIQNIMEPTPAEIVTAGTTPTDFVSFVDELAPASVADPEISQRSMDPVTFPSPCPSSVGGFNLLMTPEPHPVALRASYVADNNIPDGQIFPPGAEFVKSWKMLNDGPRDWPETTQLVWVAGDKLTSQLVMRIGMVHAGDEVDIWTGEMKVCPSSQATSSFLSDPFRLLKPPESTYHIGD
jgi:hypothetical protein